jgi:hypothetical protein
VTIYDSGSKVLVNLRHKTWIITYMALVSVGVRGDDMIMWIFCWSLPPGEALQVQ